MHELAELSVPRWPKYYGGELLGRVRITIEYSTTWLDGHDRWDALADFPRKRRSSELPAQGLQHESHGFLHDALV
jgi:hypothetical protein